MHAKKDYGAYAYLIDTQFSYGYLTLTDHLFNRIHFYLDDFGYKDFFMPFHIMQKERARRIHGSKGFYDVPIYNVKDMKLALGLHIINFLRNSNDEDFKSFALSEKLDSQQLDGILNYIFYPEFHIPRMVSTTDFMQVKLRDMKMNEAIRAYNIEELVPWLKNKDDACIVMKNAIDLSKSEIVAYLFSQFEFTREDVINNMRTNAHFGVEYNLSHKCTCEKILKMFLERGLIDPDQPITSGCSENMLEHAKFMKKTNIVEVLLNFKRVNGGLNAHE